MYIDCKDIEVSSEPIKLFDITYDKTTNILEYITLHVSNCNEDDKYSVSVLLGDEVISTYEGNDKFCKLTPTIENISSMNTLTNLCIMFSGNNNIKVENVLIFM